ncbi:protein sorting system archaetidylserine decarboxylase [Halorientalis brevis]|uniref:Protein sorting system archaetidylserine decarboxylase n=1 Tax=Halorientalis brevis TaxID=1126241 RepID=A0ABD6CER0_9EURY|nr:protein sorting system archaetidylserine decarboxylase [Halorientalis brevis]
MCARVAQGTSRYAAPLTLLGFVSVLFSPLSGLFVALAGIVVLAFHRDPDRVVPDTGIVAPADGRVSVIREEDDRLRVGIFMNLTDVHVNRAPLGGTVESVTHSPGAHWPAFIKESDRNEKVHVEFEDYTVVQIAGAVARRIYPYVEAGQTVERGDRIGHISFSSRVDVVFPEDVTREDLLVGKGESVTAGETRLVADH